MERLRKLIIHELKRACTHIETIKVKIHKYERFKTMGDITLIIILALGSALFVVNAIIPLITLIFALVVNIFISLFSHLLINKDCVQLYYNYAYYKSHISNLEKLLTDIDENSKDREEIAKLYSASVQIIFFADKDLTKTYSYE